MPLITFVASQARDPRNHAIDRAANLIAIAVLKAIAEEWAERDALVSERRAA